MRCSRVPDSSGSAGQDVLELDHLNLFVADVPRSREFYLALLQPFGYRLLRDYGEEAAGLGRSSYAVLALVRSDRPVQPIHLAFRLDSRHEVDTFHSAAIGQGARNNGAPGLRPDYHESYYAAFILDPDGHNLEAVCHRSPSVA